MNKKILLYIGGFRLPDGTASAVRCIANARLFEELGFKVVFVGKTIKGSKEYDSLWNVINGYDCLNVEKSNEFPFQLVIERFPVSNIVGVITYNYQINYLLPYWKEAKRRKIPFISDTTEWYLLEKGIDGLYRKLLTEYKMRFFNKKIKNHICSTRYIQNLYSKCNTVRIPNIVDKSDPKWNIQAHERKDLVKRRFIYAGSPGRRMKKDLLDKIVESFSRIKEKEKFELYLIGLTEKDYLDVFPEHKNTISEYDNIIFKGRISHKDVLAYTKSSDFTVLFRPNTIQCRVGFSTKIVDSISCGIPVISNDVNGDMTLYLKENEQCLILENSIESISQVLTYAIEMSEDQLEIMKKTCREDNPFDYRRFIPVTERFLRKANVLKD